MIAETIDTPDLTAVYGIGEVPWSEHWADLAWAALVTAEFTLAASLGALIIAAIVALLRTSDVGIFKTCGAVYTEILKNLPLLTWLFILYYGLPSVGVTLNSFTAGTIALATYYGTYISEVFRGALGGVHKGQREAALSVGLTGVQTIRKVVLPGAVRLALPGTTTMLVDLLKGTSLMVTIAGAELMTAGQIVTSVTFQPLEVFLVVGVIYFAMSYPLSQGALRLERKLEQGEPMTRARKETFREVGRLQSEAS